MCLNVLQSCAIRKLSFISQEGSSNENEKLWQSLCVLHSLRKSQSNAAVINTEVYQEPQFLGCLQISPARVSCRERYFEHFPVPAAVCPNAGENASFGTRKAKASTSCMSASKCSPRSLFGVAFLTQDQWQQMLILLAVNLGDEGS